ncbi:MAG: acyl-CoA synthetase [Akkermansiaceae bacterium]|nr:acyl-CoA synthetase [Akkermansiaceae bacterium]
MYPAIHASVTPDKPAVLMAATGQQVSYAELEDRSLRLANWLRSIGLRRGDVIALIADNDARVFDIYWAAQRTGLYLTAVNYRLRADEIQYILENSGARVAFVGDVSQEAIDALTGVTGLGHQVAFASDWPGYLSLEALIAGASNERPAHEPRGGDMLYSSGTTGRPKGVRQQLPERAVSEPGDTMVAMFGGVFGFSSDTVYLSPAPLYHAAPLRTCATVQALGGTAIIMDRFDPEAALEAIERWKVNVAQWVPTMFVRMLKLPDPIRKRYDVSSLKMAIHAAAPCPVEVKRAMMDWWGPVLHEYYSCTELNGMTVVGPEEWMKKPGSVGRAVLGKIHICDDEGNELEAARDGVVYFERETLPFEYHGDPDKTRSTQHPAHPTWTAVGDIGHVDEEGYLFLTDRKAFMIISGGVNIYPQEVENALALHPAIADVAVVGVPDTEMGEQVKAVVMLAEGHEPSVKLAEAIVEFAGSRVAAYKLPRSVDFVDTLPRTPTGKLLKGEVRKRYWPA